MKPKRKRSKYKNLSLDQALNEADKIRVKLSSKLSKTDDMPPEVKTVRRKRDWEKVGKDLAIHFGKARKLAAEFHKNSPAQP